MTKPKNIEQMDGCLLDTGSRAKAICRPGECSHCGWNPSVCAARTKEVRRKYEDLRLPKLWWKEVLHTSECERKVERT